MKIEDLNRSEDLFSYKNEHRFNNSKYIVAVQDEDFPGRNLIPLFYHNEGEICGIDKYDMEKILTTQNNYMPDVPPLSQRFLLNQLVKISLGTIIQNERWYESSPYPKCKTFHTCVNDLGINEVIEVFDGEISEASGKVKFSEDCLNPLINEVYIEKGVPFFIEDNKLLFGPFKAEKKDSEGYYVVEKHNWKTFGEYELNEQTYFEVVANDITRKLIVPFVNELKLITQKDFLTDDEIIAGFKNRLEKNNDNTLLIDEIINKIREISQIQSISEYIDNNERIKSILEKTENVLASDYELNKFLPEVGQIKEDIENLKNKKFDIENDYKRLSNQNQELISEIGSSKEELLKLKEQIDNIDKTKKEAIEKIKSELESEVNSLEEQKEILSQEIDCINKTKDLKELEITIDVRKGDLAKLQNEESELKAVLEQLRKENLEAQKDGQNQLMELLKQKKHFDFLSGRDLADYDNKAVTEEKISKDYCSDANHNDYIGFRNLVIDKFAKVGRKYDNHFIDNLLISIHQNTLTVFAGLPGTGKTSLARILISLLTPKTRSTEIAVHRGWTSQKDLIGFQNPLNNKFHPSSTGMYSLLSQINGEKTPEEFDNYPLAYVLLDEANLSPLEHYWSTFYNLTDSVAKKDKYLELNLGDTAKISYPNNIRFIATINSDQTTETMSPRVLDRVNMIQIPQQTLFETNVEFALEDIEDLKLSYSKCREYFGLFDFKSENVNLDLSQEVIDIYTDLKKTFNDELQIFISPRIDNAIKKYCHTAGKIMREESRPLDYCISQRILPLINMQGDKAKTKLEELQEKFKKHNLTNSSDILAKIIKRGDDDSLFEGTYNYFLTFSYAQGL